MILEEHQKDYYIMKLLVFSDILSVIVAYLLVY